MWVSLCVHVHGNGNDIKVISLSVCVCSLQMIARGKNTSDLFPAVVKNVACKNIEVSIQLPAEIYLQLTGHKNHWNNLITICLFACLPLYLSLFLCA